MLFKSLLLACAIAPTRDIWPSKSALVFNAAPNPKVIGVDTPIVIVRPREVILSPIELNFFDMTSA